MHQYRLWVIICADLCKDKGVDFSSLWLEWSGTDPVCSREHKVCHQESLSRDPLSSLKVASRGGLATLESRLE